MSGYTVTKKKRTDMNQVLISSAIILLFGSFFSSLFILMPLQELLYRPFGHWFFSPPRMAHGVFIASIIFIALLIFFKVWLDTIEKFRGKTKIIFYFLVVIAFIFMFLAINQYRYVDGKGINVNPLFGLIEKHYAWEDVEKAKQTIKGSKVTFDFTFKNGDQYSMLLNENERKSWKLMLFEMEEQGIKVKFKQLDN